MPINDALQQYPKFEYVALARNPFDRLVSCWGDKIANEVNNTTWAKRYSQPVPVKHGASFEEFARLVWRQPDDHSDRHYRSQTAQLTLDGKFLPTKIVKLEELDLVPEGCLLRQLPHEHKSERRDWRFYYTDDLHDLVARRYQEDLKQFSY